MANSLIKFLAALVAIALIINIYFLIEEYPSENQSSFSDIASENATEGNASNTASTANAANAAGSFARSRKSSSSSSSESSDSGSSSFQSGQDSQPSSGQNPQPQADSCLQRFSLSSNTVIFYYKENELHSMNMKIIVNQMNSTYTFYYMDQIWNASFNECFNLSGNIPSFVCSGSRQKVAGEISKTSLENFTKSC